MEVEIREEANPRTQHDTTSLLVNNTPAYPLEDQPELIVRAEEILLVVLVLMLWVAAITMFFNRWGQIRTLEPYQPKFQQNHHRSSCPLAPLSPPHITPQVSSIQVKQQNPISQRMSFSKYNVNCFTDSYTGLTSPSNFPPNRRPRLNSVFVAGSSAMAVINTPPRRVKSAIDIQHLIINEKQFRKPSLGGGLSLLPITSMYRERKPSIVIERLANNKQHQLYNTRRRPSMVMIDRPMLSHYNYPQRNRKASCFIDRRHKNFISFDQSERKLSIALDKSSLSSDYQQPSISFDTTPSVSFESPTVIIEHAEINHHHHHHSMKSAYSPKFSRSLEQPGNRIEKLTSPRISLSLDTHANVVVAGGCDSSINSSMSSDDKQSQGNPDGQESVSLDKESSTSVEDIKDTTSVTISFEDAAPLLEGLKSSDV